MEIIVKINKKEDIKIINNADSYLIANKDFSYRYDSSFSLSSIKEITNILHKSSKKSYILVNKIFFDEQLESLENFMKACIDIHVDGFFFTDFAVFMIASKYNYQNKCFFYHETFLRNSYDIKTYQHLGIKNIICSKDMHIDDIAKLDKRKKNNYGILLFGYFPIYESKRKVLSNFIKRNNLVKETINSKQLFLKESSRENKYRIIEQNGIASIFHDEVLSYIPYIDILSNNINMFIIDSLFFDSSYIYDVVDIVKNKKDISLINKLDESITFTEGYLNNKVGLI